jgi:ribonuclease HI
MYFDGSVMKTGAGTGLLFVSPLGEHMRYVVRFHFPTSNNMAEYEALLSGLRITVELGIKCLDIRGDSQLVIDQVMKEASCHNEKMEAYYNAVRKLEDKFYGLELNHIVCKYNEEAGKLAKIASGRITVPRMSSLATLPNRPSISVRQPRSPMKSVDIEPMDEDPLKGELDAFDHEGSWADEAEVMEIDEAPPSQDWWNQYLAWIDRGELPSDRTEVGCIARKAKSFVVIDRELYKRRPSWILQ